MNLPSPRPSSTTVARSTTAASHEYRVVLVSGTLAFIGVAAAVTAIVLDEAVLALVAAAVGVLAAAIGAFVDLRRARAESSLWEARSHTRRLRRELDQLEAEIAEERVLAGTRSPVDSDLPDGTDTDEWEIDPVSGLIRERHLAVVLQQVIASSRRKVQPTSVVYWELDAMALDADADAGADDALTALGAVAWRTLRESDAVFRLGARAAIGVLVDTAEPGAVIVAERVRTSLRASAIGATLTVSAAIACYPTHALDAVELVSRATRALELARTTGHDVDLVIVAENDDDT
jgi:diguanylate cyclase (GGDEF)-like protein